MLPDEMELADFVYTGLRLTGKGERCISLRVIDNEGCLSDERWFAYSRKSARAVGGVYRGARFSDKQAHGLESVTFVKRWPDESQRIEWEAKEQAVEAQLRLKALEADAARTSDLELALTPARQVYDSMRRRYDKAGMAALEAAVLAALRAPLRKSEK
ncbi:hypothetical protein KPB05_37340 [Burkholderia gladioli]|uniref:hypothetical protein n=1 Tax=Burkholderia gladioli TaxID=28095 RepID=UPI00285B044A|nr:hypothetical protein [Burkholderia gladioli]MDR8093124.1 hypothetical protein [Burkholderia gladioli]